MMTKYFWLLIAVLTAFTLSGCALEQATDPCTKGDRKCEGNVFYECLLDGKTWDQTVCNSDHSLGAFCNAQRICVACNEDEDCKSADKQCVEHACQPLSVVPCIEGSTTCEGGKVSTCIKKALENEKNCPNGCNTEGTACQPAGACAPNSAICDGNALKTCSSAGVWLLSVDCALTSKICDAGKGCIECKTSDHCKNPSPICNPATNTCQGPDAVCGLSESKCDGNTYKKCNTAQSGFDETLCSASTAYCDARKGCVECRNNDDCFPKLNRICNPSSNTCLECIPGESRCKAKQMTSCSTSGSWEGKTISCIKGCNSEGTACAACATGENKCEGNTLLKCNTAQSGFDETICNSPAPYCSVSKGCIECRDSKDCGADKFRTICNPESNTCQACLEGEKICIKGDLQQCGAGGMWSMMKCEAGQVCSSTLGCVYLTGHRQDFEFCSSEISGSFSAGSCTNSAAPELSFTSGMGVLPPTSIDERSLQLGANSIANTVVSKGVGQLSIEVKNTSSALTHFTVQVGGVLVFDKSNMKLGQFLLLNNDMVNIPGKTTINIQTSHPIVIDNLTWSDYYE